MKREYGKGAKFVFNFTKKIIDNFGPRLPASEEERAAARQMAEDMQQATGKPVKMEPFYTAPRASIGAIPLLGIGGFISSALYYINPLPSLILSAFILVFAVVQVFMYKGWFDFLFRQQESQNFYSYIDGGDKIDYTIVFSGHTDSSWNWNMAVKRPLIMIPKVIYGIVGILAILVLSVIRIIMGNFTVDFSSAGNIVFFILPLFFLIGFYWIAIFLSYDKSIASPGAMDNLSGVGMAMLMGKHFKENPEDLPENCRIIVAALGSEEAGLKGSSAFMNAHKDDKDLLINPYFINLDSIRDYDHFNVVKGDAWLGSHFDEELIKLSYDAMSEAGVKPGIIKNPVGGCDSTPFSRAGYKTVTVIAQNPVATNYYHTYNDRYEALDMRTLEKAYESLLNITEKIISKHSLK